MFEAVTVCELEEVTAVGVPEIVPVVVENDRPAGSCGDIDHRVAAPPLTEGVFADIVTSLVNVREVGL